MLTFEQYMARKNGIGGSDVCAILGLSKYKTPVQVYLEKTLDDEDYRKNFNQKISVASEVGNVLESFLIKKFEDTYNKKVLIEEKTFKKDHLIANVDGLVLEDDGQESILEIKTTSVFNQEIGDDFTDQMPFEWLCQVAHYCHVLEKQKAYVFVLIGNSKTKLFIYERDLELEEQIIKTLNNFWFECVQKRVPPAPKNMNDINNLYSVEKEKEKIADEELLNLCERYKKIKEKHYELGKQLDEIKFEITKAMKDSSKLVFSGKVIARQSIVYTSRFNQTLFKNENPDDYKKYCSTLSFRRLIVK